MGAAELPGYIGSYTATNKPIRLVEGIGAIHDYNSQRVIGGYFSGTTNPTEPIGGDNIVQGLEAVAYLVSSSGMGIGSKNHAYGARIYSASNSTNTESENIGLYINSVARDGSTVTPYALHIDSGAVKIKSLKAPSGKNYQVTINDQGVMSSQAISSAVIITDASLASTTYTITTPGFYTLPSLTSSNGTLTLPAPNLFSGQIIYVRTNNGSSTHKWNLNAAIESGGGTIINALEVYNLYTLISNGTTWIITAKNGL